MDCFAIFLTKSEKSLCRFDIEENNPSDTIRYAIEVDGFRVYGEDGMKKFLLAACLAVLMLGFVL